MVSLHSNKQQQTYKDELEEMFIAASYCRGRSLRKLQTRLWGSASYHRSTVDLRPCPCARSQSLPSAVSLQTATMISLHSNKQHKTYNHVHTQGAIDAGGTFASCKHGFTARQGGKHAEECHYARHHCCRRRLCELHFDLLAEKKVAITTDGLSKLILVYKTSYGDVLVRSGNLIHKTHIGH